MATGTDTPPAWSIYDCTLRSKYQSYEKSVHLEMKKFENLTPDEKKLFGGSPRLHARTDCATLVHTAAISHFCTCARAFLYR